MMAEGAASAIKKTVLVVDDSADTREVLERQLVAAGYQVYLAVDVNAALDLLAEASIDLVITDHKMPGRSGMELVRHLAENQPVCDVLMITGYASVEGAVEAVKSGAQGYLAKPFTEQELLVAVDDALARQQQRRLAHGAGTSASDAAAQLGIVGHSPPMQRLFELIRRAAATPVTVLISGETGTGKELVARAIHYQSARHSAPFVAVNCGSVPEGLLERELFGHLKGAFTGATETRAGFFETADGGTLFLDEISETSAAMQVRLLRVLQEREVCLVGDTRPRRIDVRVVAASNKPLADLVSRERFREDLYYRLAILPIDVPPLRDRGDDVLLLLQYFVDKFTTEFGLPPARLSDRALTALRSYDWPGNVRELENMVQRLLVMATDRKIDVADLPLECATRFPARVVAFSVSPRWRPCTLKRCSTRSMATRARRPGYSGSPARRYAKRLKSRSGTGS